MVEFTIALVVIMVLLAGLIQIGQMSNAHTRTMIAARADAAEDVMATNYNQPPDTRYIFGWTVGSDHKPYTHDDVPFIATNSVEDTQAIIAFARPDQLDTYVPNNDMSTLGGSADTMDEFFLVHGYDSEPVPITNSAFRTLVDNEASITVESDVWLTWTEGIY